MKNFNELFEEAKQLKDRRLKLFSELKRKFTNEILPEFAKIMGYCGYKESYFKADNKIFEGIMGEINCEAYTGYDGTQYCFTITK